MGNIHKEKTQEELLKELQLLFTGVKGVFVQQDLNEPSHNRGRCCIFRLLLKFSNES